MPDLFLIAHKVCGEPAFDVAIQMDCPLCHGERDPACGECEELGYWWIIPTSGHRAYPYWHRELDELCDDVGNSFMKAVPDMPDCPDHYAHSASPTRPKLDITALLKPAPVRIHRRF